jgi:hypothetical protein
MIGGLSRAARAERRNDLAAELTSPWSPGGAAERARFAAALRTAVVALRAPFALPDSYEIATSQWLARTPDGTEAWHTRLMVILRPPGGPGEAAARMLLSTWTDLFSSVQGEYGLVGAIGEVSAAQPCVEDLGLPDVLWANLFGPRVRAAIGEERLLGAPALRTEPLGGGGVLVVRDPDPWSWQTATARRARDRIRQHLGERFFARRRWWGGWRAARARLDLGARALSPMAVAALAERYLDGEPERLFADPQAQRRALAELLGIDPSALSCQPEKLDGTRPWDEEEASRRARWVVPLAFHLGDCVARSRGGTWLVHPGWREPVVELPGGRFFCPLVEAQGIVLDEGRVADLLARRF